LSLDNNILTHLPLFPVYAASVVIFPDKGLAIFTYYLTTAWMPWCRSHCYLHGTFQRVLL